MRDPEQIFTVFEEYEYGVPTGPKRVYLGRYVAGSSRRKVLDFSLKTRRYINTTSMDSELALLTANMALAAPGKMFYDPFVGTGSFPIACSHFGAMSLGSDIDGRMVRGKDGRNIVTNFRQYGLSDRYLDGFISDLTHSPLRRGRWLDGIVGDPPYGIREGLKVLGTKDGRGKEVVFIDGEASHLYALSHVFSNACFEYLTLTTGKRSIFLQRNLIALKPCWEICLNSPPSHWSMAAGFRYGCLPRMMRMWSWVSRPIRA